MAIGAVEAILGLCEAVLNSVCFLATEWGRTSTGFWRNLTAGLGLLVICLGCLYFFSVALGPIAAIMLVISIPIFLTSFLFWILLIFKNNAGTGDRD